MADQVNFDDYDVQVPWEEIPVSDCVDEGQYSLRIKELKLAGSREGKLMAVGYFEITEGPLAGVNFPIQNFVLGSEEDPLCNRDPLTWRKSYGGRQLNQMLDAGGVAKMPSLRQTLKRAEQARFNAYVTKSQQKDGEYAGQDQNRITKYAPFGVTLTGRLTTSRANGAVGVTGIGGAPVAPRQRMRPAPNGVPDPSAAERTNDLGPAPEDDLPEPANAPSVAHVEIQGQLPF